MRMLKKGIFITWLILVTIVVVVLLAIPPPPVVSAEFNLGLVPVGAAVMHDHAGGHHNQQEIRP